MTQEPSADHLGPTGPLKVVPRPLSGLTRCSFRAAPLLHIQDFMPLDSELLWGCCYPRSRLGGSGGRGRQRGAAGPGPRPPDCAASGGFAPEFKGTSRQRAAGDPLQRPWLQTPVRVRFSSGEQPLKERRL